MAKFKIKYVKFVFTPRQLNGTNWSTAPEPDIRFGNRFSDDTHQFGWNKHHIGWLFSEFLQGDNRCYKESQKFTESEASILLLKYLENNLKKSRKEKKRLDIIPLDNSGITYARTVNKRGLDYNIKACKIWRKKVRELKKSKEYLWEQMLK